jgi:hypothetical protein
MKLHLQSVELRLCELCFKLRGLQRKARSFAFAFELTAVYQSQMRNADDNPVNQHVDVKLAHE